MFKTIVIIIVIIIVVELYLKIKKAYTDNKQNNNLRSTNNSYETSNYDMFDNYDHFASVMDIALTFIDAYLQEVPGEWVHLYVSNTSEKSEHSTASYYI